MARKEILIEDMPAELRSRIVGEAQERNVSINEVTVSILAAAYGVEREPSGRSFRGETGSNQIVLSVPSELRDAIRLHAARRGETMRSVVIETLGKNYGLDFPAEDRRRRDSAA